MEGKERQATDGATAESGIVAHRPAWEFNAIIYLSIYFRNVVLEEAAKIGLVK